MNFEQLKNFLAVLALVMIFLQLATCSTAFARRSDYSYAAPRDNSGRIQRSSSAKSEFKRQQPCPATGSSTGGCPGYVIDHVQPLKRGGEDAPKNMQWQTKEEAKAKDRWE